MSDKKQRRQKSAHKAVDNTDRMPPHSDEAERGILGCILLSPKECIAHCIEKSRGRMMPLFYDGRHSEIYDACLEMYRDGKDIDVITLQQWLKDKKLLGQVGGIAYLSALPDSVPSAANLGYYFDIVREKAVLRMLIHTCTDVVSRVYDHEGEVEKLLDEVGRDFSQFNSEAFKEPIGRLFKPSELDRFNAEADATCLLGKRWLCRGGKLLVVGPSGVGKSSLTMQMAMHWALGKSLFGIMPVRPLKIVVIGDENDEGDLAEMFQGVRDSLELDSFNNEDEFELLDKNLIFFHCPSQAGDKFIQRIEQWLLKNPCDIALLDPLVSFADVDITRQDGAAKFLRQGLSRIADSTGVVWAVIHHTAKTSKDSKSKSNWKSSDHQYAGAGSYDLPGWARAVMTLDQVNDDTFRLMMPKRGKRAGAVHPTGEPTSTIWLKHGDKGIHWQQIDPPQESEKESGNTGRPSKIQTICGMNLHGFLSKCVADGEGKNEVSKRLESWLATENVDVNLSTCKRSIEELVKRKKLKKTSVGAYIKGENI